MKNRFEFDVFLSHNGADKPRVRKLAERLRQAGLRVWFDDWIIRLGDDIYQTIEHGLEASQTLILCMSAAAFDSDWVSLERNTALFRDPANKDRRFIPLLLTNCKLPDTLRRYKYLDYRDESESAFQELLAVCLEKTTVTTDTPEPVPPMQSKTQKPLNVLTARHADASLIESYFAQHVVAYEQESWTHNALILRLTDPNGQSHDAFSFLFSWARNPTRKYLFLLGDVGSGKTGLMRRIARELAKDASGRVPIFIPAYRTRGVVPRTFSDLCSLCDPKPPVSLVSALTKGTSIAVFLDGLDELIGPSSKDQVEYIQTLHHIANVLPNDAIVFITCRKVTFAAVSGTVLEAISAPSGYEVRNVTDMAIQRILGLPSTEAVFCELSELSYDKSVEFLCTTLPGELVNQAATRDLLTRFSRVPVILRLLQLGLPAISGRGVRVELDELYSAAVQVLLLRDPYCNEKMLADIMSELEMLTTRYDIEVSEQYVDLLIHVGLLRRVSPGHLQWSHFSIAEYFLARHLFAELERFDASTLCQLNLISAYNQYLCQLRKAEGGSSGMNTPQAGDLVENLA